MSNWDYPSNEIVPASINGNFDDIPISTSNLSSANLQSRFPKGIKILSVIVISTIITAVIAVPTTLALTSTGPFSTIALNSTSNSTVASNSSSSSTIVSTVASTTSVFFLSQCLSYRTISDSTRLSTSFGGLSCDTSIFSSNISWVRFTSPGGSEIPTWAVSSNQCGTEGSGWFNGSMPSIGVTINGTVCYQQNTNICNWSNEIQITNCALFYVYALVAPPMCNLRYCTV